MEKANEWEFFSIRDFFFLFKKYKNISLWWIPSIFWLSQWIALYFHYYQEKTIKIHYNSHSRFGHLSSSNEIVLMFQFYCKFSTLIIRSWNSVGKWMLALTGENGTPLKQWVWLPPCWQKLFQYKSAMKSCNHRGSRELPLLQLFIWKTYSPDTPCYLDNGRVIDTEMRTANSFVGLQST